VHYQLGRLEMGLKAPRKALKHLRRARELKPDEAAIWTLLLDAHIALGDEKAIAKLLRASKKAGLPQQALRALASKAAGGNKSGQARIGTLDPAEFQTAVQQYEAGEFEAAAAGAADMNARHPKAAPVLAVLGAALAALGRTEEAEAKYKAAIAVDPAYAEAHLRLGQLFLANADHDAAAAALERAQELIPDSPHLQKFLGLTYWHLTKTPQALRLLEQARTALPDDEELLQGLAACLLDDKRPRQAREVIDRVIASGSDDTNSFLIQARVLGELEENEAAKAAFEQVLKRDPDSTAALTGLSLLHHLLGDFETAGALARKVFYTGIVNGELPRQ